MKSPPMRPSRSEAQPPLERLRERVQGMMSRLGAWGKRLLAPDQEEAALAARAPAKNGEESRRESEREHQQGAGSARPVRSITAARYQQPLRSPRSYPTESLSGDTAPRRAERVESAPKAAPERSAAPVVPPAAEGEAHIDAAPPPRSAESQPPAEVLPPQDEEARRALARKLLRGSRTGLLLTLEPGYVWSQVLEVLAASLAESPTFFQKSVLSLDTRRRPLEASELEELQVLLAPYAMTFKEVGSDDLHDPRSLPSGAARPAPSGDTTPTLAIRASDATNALFTQRTIRSGQRLRYESSVVILGDVNPGAEVIAGGSVVVWGALRGTVHAGYPGNEEAVVCALVLEPVQLRIGTFASRPPEDGALPTPMPEVASVKNGQIVVESWNAGRASRR
jgi:septum site-determining protein MinC